MWYYISKRILIAIPTLLLISVGIFALSCLVPGDPIERELNSEFEIKPDVAVSDALYKIKAHELNYDLPVFYITLSSLAYPDTLYKIIRRDQRTMVEDMIADYGNAASVLNYRNAILSELAQKNSDTVGLNTLKFLLVESDRKPMAYQIEGFRKNNTFPEVVTAYDNLKKSSKLYLCYIPTFHIYGINNQYHRWLSKFLSGDFGKTLREGIPVTQKLKQPFFLTFTLTFLSLLLCIPVALFVGFYTAAHHESKLTQRFINGTMALYATPTFWIATLAVLFLTTPQYHLKIFPSVGLPDIDKDLALFSKMLAYFPYLLLPVLCMSIHPMVVLIRHFYNALLNTLHEDYIRTARAKGLTVLQALENHSLRAALMPFITVVGQIIPSAITGTFIVEYIFNIPGMGRTAYEALQGRDWSVAFAIFTWSAVVLVVVNLITDIIYTFLNPKVRY